MDEVKNIVVFGGTGLMGKAFLRRAVEDNLNVTAFARTPSKIPEDLNDKVKVIQGDVFDQEKVEEAIKDKDAVFSALGAAKFYGSTNVLTLGIPNIIAGMKKHGIKKIVVISGADKWMPGTWRYALQHRFSCLGDHARQIEILEKEKESIDWIAIRAPWILDDATVNHDYLVDRSGKSPGEYEINSGEIADFVMKTFADNEKFQDFRHCNIGISSRAKKN